jgi:acetyltransferase
LSDARDPLKGALKRTDQSANRCNALVAALDPKHIAVFGASATPDKWGYNTAKCLIENGFTGRLTLVNPRGGSVFDRPLVDASQAEGADLAVIATPAATVPDIVGQCGTLGIGLAVVIASGFAESGHLALHHALVRRIAESGVRVIGPNCVGLASNTGRVNTTMIDLPAGHVSMITQSGGVALHVARRLDEFGAGFDVVIAFGNKVDVNVRDAVQVVASRETTSAILLYIERLDEGDVLLDMLENASRELPVVALLSGRTDAGKAATASHTGSLVGQWDRAAGLLTDAGVVVADGLNLAIAAVAGTRRRSLA